MMKNEFCIKLITQINYSVQYFIIIILKQISELVLYIIKCTIMSLKKYDLIMKNRN